MPVKTTKNNIKVEIRSRVPSDLKAEAIEILNDCGLNISDAIRLFLEQVVARRELPFDVKIPNANTIAAIKESRELLKNKK